MVNMNFLVSWITIILGIGGFFAYIESTLDDEQRKRFVNWVKRFGEGRLQENISTCNEFFLNRFDSIYSRLPSRADSFLWEWILMGFFLAVLAAPQYVLLPQGAVNGPESDLGTTVNERSFTFTLKQNPLAYLLATSGLGALLYAPFFKWLYKKAQKRKRPWIALGVYFLITFSTIVPFSIGMMLVQGGLDVPNVIFVGPFMILIGVLFGFYLSIPIILVQKGYFNGVSPFRAGISSLIIVTFVTLLNVDILTSFLNDWRIHGALLLPYLLLNLFTDSVSLVETRFILQWSVNASFKKIFLLLALDILATLLIFLLLPILSGEFSTFANAILFGGERPWYGILFWSTFGTSVIYYVYLISVVLLATGHRLAPGYMGMESNFPFIKTKPFRALGLVGMILAALLSPLLLLLTLG